VTAGDLFISLQKSLPIDERESPELWQRFTAALARQTGVNPDELEPISPLLSDSRIWARLADASAMIWTMVALSFLALLATAAILWR
jgi:hypothetical protein